MSGRNDRDERDADVDIGASNPPKDTHSYEQFRRRMEETREPGWWDYEVGRGRKDGWKCIKNVVTCLHNNPGARLLLKALKDKGCPFQLSRHLSCETCGKTMCGGYDTHRNQVVICQNRIVDPEPTCSTLVHEMLHMYDNCRAKFDINNLHHVACTEIRAARLFHCSHMNAVLNRMASLKDCDNQQKDCVRRKAYGSMRATQRDKSDDEIVSAIDAVLVRCMNDTEPFGRQTPHVMDFYLAYKEFQAQNSIKK